MNHSFDIDVACDVGLLPAIVFSSVCHWIRSNEIRGVNYVDGKYWTFNSVKQWSEHFPYASDGQVRNALKKLREEGYLEVAEYNDNRADRSLWYTLTDKGRVASTSAAFVKPEEQRKASKPPKKEAPFVPPTPQMVEEYARERGGYVDGQRFCDYYASMNWCFKNGKPMKNWKNAVGTWMSNDRRWSGNDAGNEVLPAQLARFAQR